MAAKRNRSDQSLAEASRVALINACSVAFARSKDPSEIADVLAQSNAGWFDAVKILRQIADIDLAQANEVLLQNDSWLDFVVHQANKDKECAKLVSHHLKSIGNRANIIRLGNIFRKRPEGYLGQ